MKLLHWLRVRALPVALVLSFALLCAHLTVELRASTMAAVFQGEFDTFLGRPLHPEAQNRIISPGLLVALRHVVPAAISDKSVWFALRTLEAVLAYLVLYSVALRVSGSRLRALAAVGFVVYVYVWTTLSHPTEFTSDFFDIMFTAWFVELALAERWFLLVLAVVVAAANRESAAFAGVIALGLATARFGPWPENWRRFVPGVVLIVLAAGVVLGLRYALGGTLHSQQLGIIGLVVEWNWILYPDGQLPELIAVLLAATAVLLALPLPWTIDQKGLGLGAAVCALVSCTFGIAAELRIWLPCATIVGLLAVIGGRGLSDKQWLASMAGERN